MSAPPPRIVSILEEARLAPADPDWIEVLEACLASTSEDAQFVDPDTTRTPLHLAVLATASSNNTEQASARLEVIRMLIQLYPGATRARCAEWGYTPLHSACAVSESHQLLIANAPVVALLMDQDPKAVHCHSLSGHSALEVHLVYLSRLQQYQHQHTNRRHGQGNGKSAGNNSTSRVTTGSDSNCTAILKALVEPQDLGISLPRTLDLVLACNSLEIIEQVAQEEAHSFVIRLKDRRKQRQTPSQPLPIPSGSKRLANFWIWQVVLVLLHAEHTHTYKNAKPMPPFDALHTASQIADCNLFVLLLGMRAYPAQVRTPNAVQSDRPLHSVSAWEFDATKAARKSMALTQLASEHPSAARTRNGQGKTPLKIAIDSGTAWNAGVRRLTAAQHDEQSVIHRMGSNL